MPFAVRTATLRRVVTLGLQWCVVALAAFSSACSGPATRAAPRKSIHDPSVARTPSSPEVLPSSVATVRGGTTVQQEQPAPGESATSDTAELAKASQNPVGNIISLPLKNSTSFGIGPDDATSNVLNIQPVYPVSLGSDWNLINRAIVPLIYQEEVIPGTGSASGLGDISYTGFFSPAKPGKVIWGVGPSFLFPSATDDRFASDKLSVGAGVVALTMPGNWVVGALAQNVWSVAGDSNAADVNFLLLQPIINYNLDGGWYLKSVPVLTANWEADSSNRWTVPLGGGFGRITHVGNQPVDISIQGFYNVVRPEPGFAQLPNIDNQGDTWTLEVQFKLLF